MRSVKTSMWSVSGLRKNHRFERALRHAAKQNIFFSLASKKTFLFILLFQYFFINLPMLTMSETLSADAGCGSPLNAECVPCGRPPIAEARSGWGRATHEERLDCGEHIYD